jgi:hypothetical protein
MNSNNNCIVCPLTGFKFFLNKNFLVGALLMVVWSNLFSWFWHGNIMAELYQSTAQLWRAPTEMNPLVLNGGISLMAVIAAYIFMKGYEGTGWREGLRFGILVTLFFGGMGLITFATQPMPWDVIKMWAFGDFLLYSIGGILLTTIYKKTSCSNSGCAS